jgi:hypothetical protein
MNAIPLALADGVSKRSLVKNIRELYRAKGTSEGHKIFFNMLLGEVPVITYPNQYMVRASGGNWGNKLIMRVSPTASSVGDQAVSRKITGLTSGASAVVVSAASITENAVSIIEFELNRDSLSPNASFVRGETIRVVSNVTDTLMLFTVNSIVSSVTIDESGALYGAAEEIEIDTDANIGNGKATARIGNIKSGKVSGVVIDDAGTKYEVGDVLTFTVSDSNTSTAAGIVSVIDGSIVINGTDKYSTDGGDFLVFEDATTEQEYLIDIELETATQELNGQKLLLNGTDGDSNHAGHNFILETTFVGLDTYGTVGGDQIAIEEGTDYTGGITKIFLTSGGSGYNKLPTVTVTSTSGTGTSLLATTDNIGSSGEIEITNSGFAYTADPTPKFNANFVLKDITGTFAANETLASSGHTGTIVSFDDTTNVLKTSFDNVVRSELEVADEEGITLEDSLRVGGDNLDTRMIFNNTLDEEEFILTEDGAQLIGLNATATDDEYLVLDDGTGETAGSAIVLESPDNTFFPPLLMESAVNDIAGHGYEIADESGNGDVILMETGVSLGASSYQLERIITEESTQLPSAIQDGDSRLITNAAFDTAEFGDHTGFFLLDGTDTTVVDGLFTDENSKLLNEEFGDTNQIILNGTDSDGTDENALLLQNVDEGDGQIIFDGTDSSGTDVNDHVVFTTIDFFEDATGINPHPTTITSSSGASAKIAKANIASGVASISPTAETSKTYGQDITSLIGEDLNRIQDSYYYQQFSYEIEAGFGTNSYLEQLKKAVHPAGFAVFGKVKIASSVSVAIANAGSSLGGGYYSNLGITAPADKFSAILASTFEKLFDDSFQRRLRTNPNGYEVGAYEQRVILEDAEDVTFITDAILLNGTDSSSSDAGFFLREEETVFIRLDERIQIEEATDTTATSPESFIIQESGDRIISETGIALSNNLALDGTGDSGHVSPTGAGDDILLDGTDSDGTDGGESLELEIASSDHVGKFSLFALTNEDNTLLNEAGGSQQLETSNVGGGSDYDLSIVSTINTKVNIPLATPRHANNGLILLGVDPFHNSSTVFGVETGLSRNGKLILNSDEDSFGRLIDGGENFLMEDDPNNNSHFRFDNILEYTNDKIVLNGTDGSSTNAGDSIVLNGTDENSSNADSDIIGESVLTYDNTTLSDIIRPDLIVLSHDEKLGIDHDVDSANTRPSEPVAILLEESQASGFFRQENETTAPDHHGDKIVLEDKTGVGFNNKLIIESTRLEAEDAASSGTIPFQNLTNSNFEPFTRSSFIQTTEYGAIDLEDAAFEVTNIQLEDGFDGAGCNLVYDGIDTRQLYEGNTIAMQTFFDISINYGDGAVVLNGTDGSSTDAGDRFRFELATDENIDNNLSPSTYQRRIPPAGGFDSTLFLFSKNGSSLKTFDSTG